MALLFEITFAGTNWGTFGFTIVKDGIQGLEAMRSIRLDLDWPFASNTPIFYGSELESHQITVTGVVEGSSRGDLKTKLEQIKDSLADSLGAVQELYFGDDLVNGYRCVFDGTFTVKMIGSVLHGSACLLTVGFQVFSERS